MDAYRLMLEERVILTRVIAHDERTTEHLTAFGHAIMDCWDDDFLSLAKTAGGTDQPAL